MKFDIYAKSTMAYLDYPEFLYGKKLSYVQKKLKKNMKLYFGTNALAKFRKNSKQRAFAIAYSNPSNVVQNVNNTIKYLGGEWDENALPRGYVSKILKKSSKKFEVTYRIMWYNSVEKKIAEPCDYTSYTKEMGVYKISLKKASNRFGFIITGIKRTKSNITRY